MRLVDCTDVLRSKNAGPYHLTFDVFFSNPVAAEQFVSAWRAHPDAVATLLGVDAGDLVIEEIESLNAVKITVPRSVNAGAVNDRDVLGCQQVAVLMDMEV